MSQIPPPPSVQDSNIRCIQCGFNLTGVTLGSTCPECGAPVSRSFQAHQQAPTSGKAITSMVLGICSIPTCMCYGVPGLICAILALVFWKLAAADIAQGTHNPASLGMAKAGMICGIIGLVLSLAYFGFIAAVIVFPLFL